MTTRVAPVTLVTLATRHPSPCYILLHLATPPYQVTKTLVNRYNYKPFLSKTACSFYSEPGDYLEIQP